MKKVLSIILAAAIIVCQLTIVFSVLPVKARASSLNLNCGYNATWDLDSNGVLTISGTGDMYDFTTIAIHYEKPWSLFLSEITSVVIEEGITDIGRGAFAGCSNLKSIHLPASLETINQSAFYSARNLETITVAEGSKLMCIEDTTLLNTKWYANQPDGQPIYIGRTLYKYKTSSSTPFSLNVADGTYAIADKAFYNCALTGITFPDSLASIGSDAFTGTDWLSAQPQGAIYAGKVFLKYNGTIPVSQSDYVIKNGTLGIAANAFADSSRVMTVSIPQSVINIGNSAFSGCSNLEKIEFAENSSLRYAGNEVFKGCSALASVNLPEKLESIGEKAFNKSGITALDLGKNVKSIGYRFAYESSLTEISVSEENLHYSADSNGILYNKDKSLLITAPTKAVLAEYTVNENCKEIMSYAFAGVNVKKVTLNDGLEIIGDRVFEYCHIGSTSIPDSVKKIGACLFFYSGLTNITLGKGIDTLPESTFALTGIREVYVPSNIKIIEKGAFINCFYLRKVTILKPVKEIGSSVFEGCDYVNVYCYKNSTAYNYAVDNSISYVLLDGTVDSAEIKASLQSAAAIDRSLYTPESLADLDKAVNAVNLNAEGLTQEQVNQWKSAIDEAIKNLEYKTADYSAIDSLSEKTDGIDRSLYTPESLADLD
ncbi:MAG: leucine-rich repeat domain-containing protein, partial [Clostridia bacterium]|nr:leucine-rich repeat domain-containing protein [Clostridia bacterium]